jgi:hypothetical protein
MIEPTSLPELAKEIRRVLHIETPSRPFIADGSPFGCEVAIVGINPGTAASFWNYWSDSSGFSRTQWVSDYYARPGARRNATRNRIERLVPALAPMRVIELNAYPYSTRTEAEIPAHLKDPAILHLMLGVAKPRVLFLFGKAPSRVVPKFLGLPPLELGTTASVNYNGKPIHIFAESHLSRGWSYAAVDALAERIKQKILEAQ